MTSLGWLLVGVNLGMLAMRLAYGIGIRAKRAEYDRFIKHHDEQLEALKARNEQRYVDLRKRLGLPPQEQEWS